MKLFFLLSILFHGVILFMLFSLRIPLVDRLFPRSVIEVSLIAMVEEKTSQTRAVLPAAKKKKLKAQPVEKKEEAPKEMEAKKPLLSQGPDAPKPLKEPIPEKIQEQVLPSQPSPEEKEQEESPPTRSLAEEREKDKDPPPRFASERIGKDEDSSPRSSPETIRKKDENPSSRSGPDKTPAERALGDGTDISASGANVPSTSLAKASLIPAASLGIPLSGGPMGKSPGEKKEEGRDSAERAGSGEKEKPSKVKDPSAGMDETLLLILRKIEAVKKYPRMARRMGIEGKATVRFQILPNGSIGAVEILESSGFEILDQASLQTVRDAAPLPYKEGWLKVGIVFKIM